MYFCVFKRKSVLFYTYVFAVKYTCLRLNKLNIFIAHVQCVLITNSTLFKS